jgi:hypothetical protein
MMKDAKRRMSQAAGIDRWKQWTCFQSGVARLSSWLDVWDFGAKGPKPGTPGSSFYTNLCYFVRYDSIPLGANAAQVAIYDALVARLGRPTRRSELAMAYSRDV